MGVGVVGGGGRGGGGGASKFDITFDVIVNLYHEIFFLPCSC